MKILCIIDSLGPGGAQRQIVNIAVCLKNRGHEVKFIIYHNYLHFYSYIKKENIECNIIEENNIIKRIYTIRKILNNGWQDVVLAFLEGSIFYSELSTIPKKKWGLVVCERSANPAIKKGIKPVIKQFHRRSDYIICNSYTNNMMLVKMFPFMRKKIFTIYNIVDMKKFNVHEKKEEIIIFKIIVAASYHDYKNMLNLAKAAHILKKENINDFCIDWYGAIQKNNTPYAEVKKYIKDNKLENTMYLHEKAEEIEKKMKYADVIALLSYFEGLPNAICEGMACGKPILISNVCDATNLVKNGVNGYLCDPYSPEDIAKNIKKLLKKSRTELNDMGKESRKMAENMFREKNIIDEYEKILYAAYSNEKKTVIHNYPKIIPDSAIKTLKSW
jgi:glycosyltransferase involved in cell wall biosynthesis